MPELKFIEGEIQRIKNDRKAVSLLGNWYNSFVVIDKEINQNDKVKITYTVKGDFNNIKKIEVLEKIKQITEVKSTNEMSNQTLNTILMCAKDIQVAWIETAKANVVQIPIFKDIVSEIKESI